MDEVGIDSGSAYPSSLRYPLTKFYRRLAKKKAEQVAVIATARKMLKVVYWMLKEKGEYHP